MTKAIKVFGVGTEVVIGDEAAKFKARVVCISVSANDHVRYNLSYFDKAGVHYDIWLEAFEVHSTDTPSKKMGFIV